MFTRFTFLCSILLTGCANGPTPTRSPAQVPSTPVAPEPSQESPPVEPPAVQTPPVPGPAPVPEPAPNAPGGLDPSGKQGVRGTVVRVEGDFMPPLPPGHKGTVTPIVTRVFVFRGAIKSDSRPDEKHPQFVTVTKTDKAGAYNVSLLPGKYTIVAEIDGKLYLNAFDGAGNWNQVEVEPGKRTEWKIADNSRATY